MPYPLDVHKENLIADAIWGVLMSSAVQDRRGDDANVVDVLDVLCQSIEIAGTRIADAIDGLADAIREQ